ncbi:UDP-N-acetylmuramoylalanyl-D-glutamate--2,6-diaminopimelate ligase [Candidatus Phaeomarinobacter ectocarpi]|uniref:UDP-N-acetylmuramoyl-L-alanyl-D-glutamate--2,6-diaminopimelate ligase n=1 Tax=Candidatus Phaeomarinibacter ectocarpi TaxID=1458461 RepID=X5MDQ7_9HYPH|nr:UDP-N-acetylmuramoyl-L-alanyl-D-glutamate--2,6-diaminopimelate ligase [Candidatus Phaeomarinobacter ectocarpi]CDO58684.1 UDP-N-acetylmuramoylalanyl-D-glutamate--2,6-diaminopimelate ligase [Candidatus Phaeomarinobacter ectocarpi]
MDLAHLLGARVSIPQGAGTIDITGLTEDSRKVKPGFLFAALPGTQVDGAKFIPKACEQGAVAILAPPGTDMPADYPDVTLIADRNPRRRFALAAANFYHAQPHTAVAVTGTNGKTSVASFVRQIWERLGTPAASIGTLGVMTAGETRKLIHTTPDPVTLHAALAELAAEGIQAVAVEASSHGLVQHRLDGVELTAAAFTNISRDHMDYHETFEDYAYAKMRLFGEVLPPGGTVVLNADAPLSKEIAAVCWARAQKVISVGFEGTTLKLEKLTPTAHGQNLTVLHEGRSHDISLPLVGDFQASNALVAVGLVAAAGAPVDRAVAALSSLEGAAGRLEMMGTSKTGAAAYVDYAHTPDALETAITALRPHTAGRLVVVFGCGGDRDAGKRPQMGEIAVRLADAAIVTDDNPRSEDAAAIRADIMAAAPGARDIGDRAQAIKAGLEGLGEGDVLLVAGKGHETGQIVGDEVRPFDDRAQVKAALQDVREGA